MTEKTPCANFALNQEHCPCASADCTRHGICCECAAYHVGRDSKSACMRPTAPAAAHDLPTDVSSACLNRARNNKNCPCDETSCARHGLCCVCLRYHRGNRTWPAAACMS